MNLINFNITNHLTTIILFFKNYNKNNILFLVYKKEHYNVILYSIKNINKFFDLK
jgi:hypothetical protein